MTRRSPLPLAITAVPSAHASGEEPAAQPDDDDHEEREEDHVHGRCDPEPTGADGEVEGEVRQDVRALGGRAIGENVDDDETPGAWTRRPAAPPRRAPWEWPGGRPGSSSCRTGSPSTPPRR